MQSINDSHDFSQSSEDISNQIDRLNLALEVMMKEIEISSCSRNPSRVSVINSDVFGESSSDSSEAEINYDSTIEKLLQSLDRQQMVIEDLFSEEKRRTSHSETKERCGHDLNRIRKEVWLQVKMQKNEQNERERKRFEEKLEMLDSMQEDYQIKRKELYETIEKLKLKEKLLAEKEKVLNNKEQDLRNQRLWMDRMKNEWELERKAQKNEVVHSRHSSYSHLTVEPGPALSTSHQALDVSKSIKEEFKNSQVCTKQDQFQKLQKEIRRLEDLKSSSSGEEILELDIKIESLKGKLATIRGEIAISESSKATRLMSSMMMSIKKEVTRDEKIMRLELIQAANKNLSSIKGKEPETPVKTKTDEKTLKPDEKTLKPDTRTEKTAENDAPIPKGFKEPNEKGLKDFISQPGVIKLPGAKELIDKVNLTLNKLSNERLLFDREKEEFLREKSDWLKSREKSYKKK